MLAPGLSFATLKIEKAENITISLFPATEGVVGDKGCVDFFGRCMIFKTTKPVFQLKGFKFSVSPRKSPKEHDQIHIPINKKQSSDFEKTTSLYSGEGKRLAMVFNGKILHAPKVRSKVKTNTIMIDFCNQHLYGIVVASFRGKISQNYSFEKDLRCKSYCSQ